MKNKVEGILTSCKDCAIICAVKVKRLRQKWGLTQVEFAERLGVSVLTVRRWEKGYNQPSPMAQKLLDELGVNQKEEESEDEYKIRN